MIRGGFRLCGVMAGHSQKLFQEFPSAHFQLRESWRAVVVFAMVIVVVLVVEAVSRGMVGLQKQGPHLES